MNEALKIILTIFLSFITLSSYAVNSLDGIKVYQKNLLKEKNHLEIKNDLERYRNADDLWEELRYEFSLYHYEENPLVQDQIEFFMNHQEFLRQCALHAAPYLYYILEQSKKYNLPAEIVLLPMIESSYDPYAHSSAGAVGIWQMMPETATNFGIHRDWWYDGRRDLVASTKGALHYLSYLNSFFNGNWLFALAAYDTGEGHVLTAIRKNIRDGKKTDYWSLPLAQETKNYIPRLYALATIIAHPETYPIYLPPVHNAPYLAQVDVGGQMNLHNVAKLAGIPLKKLLHLNPAFNQIVTAPHGPYKLLLPIESVSRFTENLAHPNSSHHQTWINYKVRRGDTLASLSEKFNTTSYLLRTMNKLPGNSLKVGKAIIVPKPTDSISHEILKSGPYFAKSDNALISSTSIATKEKYQLQPGDTIYMLRNGDTLPAAAKRFHSSTAMISAANDFNNTTLKPDMKIIIPTHLNQTPA